MAYSSQGSGGATWKRQSVMTAKKKRQNRSSMATSVRTVQCEYCGRPTRDVWGVRQRNQILGSSVSDDCCFTKYRKDREMESEEGSR